MPSLTPKKCPCLDKKQHCPTTWQPLCPRTSFSLAWSSFHKPCLESGLLSVLPLPAYTARCVPSCLCRNLCCSSNLSPSLPIPSQAHLICHSTRTVSVNDYILKIYLVLWKKLLAHSMFCYFLIALFHIFPLHINLFGILYLVTSVLRSLEVWVYGSLFLDFWSWRLTSLCVQWACIVRSDLVAFNPLEFWEPKSRMLSLARICFTLWCMPGVPSEDQWNVRLWGLALRACGELRNCGFLYFSFYTFSLPVLWTSVAKCTHISDCSVFLVYRPLYCRVMSSTFRVMVLVLKPILSNIYIAAPAFFWLEFTWHIFPHPLNFNLCLYI